ARLSALTGVVCVASCKRPRNRRPRVKTAPDRGLTLVRALHPTRSAKSGYCSRSPGDMKLFFNDLDDLHQWDFMRNQQMVKEIERLRVLLTTTNQRRESWKVRALMAEAQLVEATAKTGNKGGGAENVSDVRYASLKRYLAKRFHPDYAPGQGIEKIV